MAANNKTNKTKTIKSKIKTKSKSNKSKTKINKLAKAKIKEISIMNITDNIQDNNIEPEIKSSEIQNDSARENLASAPNTSDSKLNLSSDPNIPNINKACILDNIPNLNKYMGKRLRNSFIKMAAKMKISQEELLKLCVQALNKKKLSFEQKMIYVSK